jgi:hypothetical protein
MNVQVHHTAAAKLLTDAEAFDKILAMRGSLAWNPYSGGFWTCSAYSNRDHVHGSGERGDDDPKPAIVACWEEWLAAGGHRREPFDAEEAARADARCREVEERAAAEVLANEARARRVRAMLDPSRYEPDVMPDEPAKWARGGAKESGECGPSPVPASRIDTDPDPDYEEVNRGR